MIPLFVTLVVVLGSSIASTVVHEYLGHVLVGEWCGCQPYAVDLHLFGVSWTHYRAANSACANWVTDAAGLTAETAVGIAAYLLARRWRGATLPPCALCLLLRPAFYAVFGLWHAWGDPFNIVTAHLTPSVAEELSTEWNNHWMVFPALAYIAMVAYVVSETFDSPLRTLTHLALGITVGVALAWWLKPTEGLGTARQYRDAMTCWRTEHWRGVPVEQRRARFDRCFKAAVVRNPDPRRCILGWPLLLTAIAGTTGIGLRLLTSRLAVLALTRNQVPRRHPTRSSQVDGAGR